MHPSDNASKIFLGGIPKEMSKVELIKEVQRFGRVRDAWISYNPGGFAFIDFHEIESAEEAIRSLDGKSFRGRRLKANFAKPPSSQNDGGGGGHQRRRPPQERNYNQSGPSRPSSSRQHHSGPDANPQQLSAICDVLSNTLLPFIKPENIAQLLEQAGVQSQSNTRNFSHHNRQSHDRFPSNRSGYPQPPHKQFQSGYRPSHRHEPYSRPRSPFRQGGGRPGFSQRPREFHSYDRNDAPPPEDDRRRGHVNKHEPYREEMRNRSPPPISSKRTKHQRD